MRQASGQAERVNSIQETEQGILGQNAGQNAGPSMGLSDPAVYRLLMEQLETGVLIADGQRRILECNGAAVRLLNARAGSLTGKTLLEATLSFEIGSLVSAAQTTGQTQQQEIRRGEPAGRMLRARVIPLPSPQDQSAQMPETGVEPNIASAPAQYLLLLEDVTELRRLETVRRDFVANVSHELRTPLASIRAMAETLQDGALHDGEVASRFVNIIVGEVERLTRILEDLLILSRAESQMPEREPFALTTLVRDVTERLTAQAAKAQLTLVNLNAPALEIAANRDQIEQVLVNLIDNAIKYTPPGGKITVSMTAKDGEATVCVEDTGIGIMSQDVPRLFERFYRVDKARSRQSGGTGLGLSIVKHIVEMHGGRVEVQSEYERGSVFSFSLPLQSSE